ncbi:MAG: MFS transporter, partial [Anaerolineales bacterium]|nr:MFS transporter [Anaerolineales bacterium]
AAVAWFLPGLGPRWGLILTFFFLLWQGLGGGFTATAWQSMIGKIIPGNRWGFFYGSQAAAANLLSSLGVVLAGYVLEKTVFPGNYALCFLLTSAVMVVSWVFIALTREGEGAPIQQVTGAEKFHHVLFGILRKDGNFRAFIAGRILYQFGTMAFAFYTVYAVRTYGMSEVQVGVLTGVLTGSQMIANPLVGWLGDRWSHRGVLIIGAVTAALSVLAAWYAPSEGWFYLVFALAGIANVAFWTTGLAITLEFGTPAERPNYIGLSNTLIGPTAILVPILGGWLADLAGYRTTFLASTLGGLLALGVFSLLLRDPKRGIQN